MSKDLLHHCFLDSDVLLTIFCVILYIDINSVIDIRPVGNIRFINMKPNRKRNLPTGCTVFSLRITKINAHDDQKWWMVCEFSSISLTAGDIYIFSEVFKNNDRVLKKWWLLKVGLIGLSDPLIILNITCLRKISFTG